MDTDENSEGEIIEHPEDDNELQGTQKIMLPIIQETSKVDQSSAI